MKKLDTIDVVQEILRKNEKVKFLFIREYPIPASIIPAENNLLHKVSKSEFLDKECRQKYSKSINGRFFGTESLLETKDGNKHIPMIDFQCKKTESNLKAIIKLFNQKIIPKYGKGYILETDNSYHFIGTEKLLDENEMIDFLSWSLLCVDDYKTGENYVDIYYLGYCLLKRSMCLRITPYSNESEIPKVVYKFRIKNSPYTTRF